MTHPGRFLALVLLASVTSLGLIYHYFGFSAAPPVLVPGVEQEADLRLKPVIPIDDAPTILEPTEHAVFPTAIGHGGPSLPSNDAYPDIGGGESAPRRDLIPLDSPIADRTQESADLRSSAFEFFE